MIVQEGLPTNGAHVNVADLHPELKARLRLLFDRWKGDPIQIRSGARTHAHQKRLYQAYLDRGRRHPVVANPDRINTGGRRGSAHQVQRANEYRHGNLPNGGDWAYAVDLMWRFGYPTEAERKELHRVAASCGLWANVKTEWWHLTPTLVFPLVTAPAPDGPDEATALRRINRRAQVALDSLDGGDIPAARTGIRRIISLSAQALAGGKD